ncbi:MAG: hypothetical protein J0H66_02535 [Solirubrobacterales bacterium]|nr:hypothetical protein [Solirubrobacterales bacterium]
MSRFKRPEHKRRARFGKQLPKPAERATLRWGLDETPIQRIRDARLVQLLMADHDFQATVGSYIDNVDRRNQTARGRTLGRKATWTAMQLETILLYRRLSGKSTIKRALIELRADPGERAILGLPDVLPSEPTISRYLTNHSDPDARETAYLELDRRLRDRVTDLPNFDEEARILAMDGSSHETHYAPPPSTQKHAEKFKGKITAVDGGYLGGRKAGKGWQLITMVTERGTPVAWSLTDLNKGEKPVGAAVVESYAEHVLPKRNQQTLTVCSCDGGFQSPRVHRAMIDARIVPNIHKGSHADSTTSKNSNKKKERNWTAFYNPNEPHYSNWAINGLEEITCNCGDGRTERYFEISPTGKLTIGTKGSCKNCGAISIMVGKWRRAQNPKRASYMTAQDQARYTAAPTIGNPLHFHDPVAHEYGLDRFGWNESFHAVLQKRFDLLGKSWMRSAQEARTEFAVAFSAISILLLERHKRETNNDFKLLTPSPSRGVRVIASTKNRSLGGTMKPHGTRPAAKTLASSTRGWTRLTGKLHPR